METKQIPTYAEFVNRLFNWSDDPSKNFGHAILGIVTEIHEYLSAEDALNGLEELGDIEFYVEALRQLVQNRTGIPTAQFDPDSVSKLHADCDNALGGPAQVIADLCNTLLDDAKRWIGYGKEPRSLNEVFNTCRDLVTLVNWTGPYPCTDVTRIREVNMKKLMKRYPGGDFSAHFAVNRDVGAERVVLQTA